MNALSPVQVDALATAALSPITDTHPDAALLAACAKFDALEQEMRSTFLRGLTVGQEEKHEKKVAPRRQRIFKDQALLLETITAHPPRTLQGAVATARSLEFWDQELLEPSDCDHTNNILLRALVRGLLDMDPVAGVQAVTATGDVAATNNPDGALIALCQEFSAGEIALTSIYGNKAVSDDAADRLATPFHAARSSLLDALEGMTAATTEGIAARAMALAHHGAIKPGYEHYEVNFDPKASDVTGRLLHMLLRDAAAMQAGAL